MAVSSLQQSAFSKSEEFVAQVNTIVVEQALYKNDFTPNLDSGQRATLAEVVKRPQNFGFASTIVADTTWAVTYDGWAADPEATTGAIRGGVQKYFTLLTNYEDPPPAEEAPEAAS